MRSTTLFYSAMNFLIACFFVLFGLLALILPWIGVLRRSFIELLVSNPFTMSIIGIGFVTVGAVMLLSICGKQREYYHLKTGDRAVMLADTLFNDYINTFWEQQFPNQEFVSKVSIKGDRIHIVADLPPLPFDQQRPFLKRAEEQLGQLFADKLGYHRGFSLSISFHDSDRLLSMN
ncbi:Uncharacterized protein SCG7086_BE_00130 [Chlamydiales bacterium SCGC AG-110-P3]|nr:Uncharacterized protein SCG7086_BE_00130 [Chlamydiales bacterium SCGC AG-110-P3]